MSELALQLIAENKRTRDTFLDLGICGLTEVPPEVGDLWWLESVSFASAWSEWDDGEWRVKASRNRDVANESLINIQPLGRLTRLRSAIFDNIENSSQIAALSALRTLRIRCKGVTDLRPLTALSALQTLSLSSTAVTDIAPLAHLSALRTLRIRGKGVTDLKPLTTLTALQTLFLSRTQVTDLRPLANLPSLESLFVSDTNVSDVTPLAKLSSLRIVDISNTQVSDLKALIHLVEENCPILWSSRSWEGPGIYVEGCPLTNPPPEIVKQGNEAILNYFEERQSGESDHLFEAKMLIVGEGGSGKTSLLRRLYEPGEPLPEPDETTKGISIHRREFQLKNGRRFRLNVWDFGGQEIYHATHQFFLTRRSLYLLVDDTRKDDKSVSDPVFRYWLELIDVFAGHSPVLIFQNEKGGRSKAIDIGGIKARHDNVKELYKGDLANKNAADQLQAGIEFFAANLPHIGDDLPARWIKVREDIESRAAQVPYIPWEEYLKIYSGHLDPDEAKALYLSRYFHDLGVFLHFQDDSLLTRTVILQNQWATEAVFRVLDDEIVKAKLGYFTEADCQRLWRDSVYARMHPELLALMERFELCYRLRDSATPTWLATQLLPPTKPANLSDWSKPDDLVLRYRYDFLPKGMISRLMVRLNRYARRPEMAWTTGVLFEHDHSESMVQLLPDGREIELRARGTDRKELLFAISSDLDALNDSFSGLRDKVDKRVPCNCKTCRTASAPYFYGHKNLLRRKEHNQLKTQCEISFEEVDVLALLDAAAPPPHDVKSRTIRIFLASSSELRDDRNEFELYFRRQNDRLSKNGLYLEIVRWENFLDAISETLLQDEYNKAIRTCDIFVCLFFTKAGKFTVEEFEVAHGQFKLSGRQPRVYTYFSDANVKLSNTEREGLKSLWAFQDKLKELGHYRSNYDNIEHLKLQFRDQLDKLLEPLQ